MKNVLVIICSCFLIIISWNTVGADLTELQARGKKLVTGGQNAALGETPYQVFLQEKDMKFCGGIILTKYEILTAAHCFDGKVDKDGTVDGIEVVAGALKLQTPHGNRMAEGPQIQRVRRVHIHPKYQRIKKFPVNDLAIARVNQSFEFNTYIRNANLPNAEEPYPIGKVKASGWGPMEEDQLLNIAELQLLSPEDCAVILYNWLDSKDWNDKILCAEWSYDGRIHEGDSGGPLYKDGVVIGIVSAGDERGLEFFTRVSQYVDWILRTSGHLKDEL